jgi:hypothetical protein
MSAATLSPSRAAILSERVSGAPRRGLVRRIVTEWRIRHSELRATPVTLEGLRAVCARERIKVRPTRRRSCLGELLDLEPYGLGDARILFVNEALEGPARLFVIAHELGHAALHARDPEIAEAYRTEMRTLSYWYEQDGTSYRHLGEGPVWQTVEAEADRFAELLLGADVVAMARQAIDALELAA